MELRQLILKIRETTSLVDFYNLKDEILQHLEKKDKKISKEE